MRHLLHAKADRRVYGRPSKRRTRAPRYTSPRPPSRTAVLGCSSPASKTEMLDDRAVARETHIADLNDKFRTNLVTGGRTDA